MMKQTGSKIIALLLAAASAAAVLSACTKDSGADWEDTLPSAVTTASSGTIMVIEEDTKPPISISMPETTTTTARRTELATTATPADGEETEDTVSYSTVTGIPAVPSEDLTSTAATTTVPSSVSSSEETFGTSTTASGAQSSSEETETFSATVSSEEFEYITTAEEENGEKSYVFNDPISRPYCYFTLDKRLRQAYDIMINAITRFEEDALFPTDLELTADEYCDLYQMIYDSEHSIYYISTQMRYTTNVTTKKVVACQFVYIYTEDEIHTMQQKIDEAAGNIINEITEEMTEYDIVKLFYDKLAGEVIYDEEAPNLRDIYGSLVDKKAVCGGYAKAFSYLCDRVGIESLTITGDFGETPHMWNMVKLDGEWYHVDATSGYVKDPVVPYVRYDYFCTNDEIISKSRTVYEQSYTYPKAESMKYNYYVYNGLVADSVESVEKLLMDGIITASEKGEGVIQFACSDDKVFEDVVYYLFDKSQANALDIYDKAYSLAAKKYNCESIIYNQEKETRVIKLFLEYLD